MGGSVTEGEITLGGSITVVDGVSCGMGGGCSVLGRTESRGIEWGPIWKRVLSAW